MNRQQRRNRERKIAKQNALLQEVMQQAPGLSLKRAKQFVGEMRRGATPMLIGAMTRRSAKGVTGS